MKFFASAFAIILYINNANLLYSATITSNPIVIALADRPVDHPYTYQVVAAGASSYILTEAPEGMEISATGLITWVPNHTQTYYNNVTVAVDGDSQSFRVFVHGLTQATVDNLAPRNVRFDAQFSNTINQDMIWWLGDSQSNAAMWGGNIFKYTPNHNPYLHGHRQPDNNTLCDVTLNGGNTGQSHFRHGGHGCGYGSCSGQRASWGLSNAVDAFKANCGGGALATLHYGHNDGNANVSSSAYASNIDQILDVFDSLNVIPIMFTTPPAQAGGGWGSASALALYPEYADSVVSIGKRRGIPVVDLAGLFISAINRPGNGVNIVNDLLADDVHYNTSNIGGGSDWLHDEKGGNNLSNHLLLHMLGYLVDAGVKSVPLGFASQVNGALGWMPDSHRVAFPYPFTAFGIDNVTKTGDMEFTINFTKDADASTITNTGNYLYFGGSITGITMSDPKTAVVTVSASIASGATLGVSNFKSASGDALGNVLGIPIEGSTSVNTSPIYEAGQVSASPNPFNPMTTISFPYLKEGVEISIYNGKGQEILSPVKAEGFEFTWNPGNIPNGLYLIHVKVGALTLVKKITLLK